MSRSREAFWWSLFAAGGVLASLLVPALVITTGFVLPTIDAGEAAERHEQLSNLLSSGFVKLVLVVVIGLAFFHCAHRIRHMLMDLGLRSYEKAVSALCYGGATLGLLISILIVTRI